MKRLSTFISICIAHLIYHLSFLVPRKGSLWVCVGWHTGKERELFADNAKYFFLHVHATQKDIRIVWLARDNALVKILREHGYHAHCIHSFAGAFYALRAGYTFIDAYLENRFWKYTGGSKVVQLWHGKGLKKTGNDSSYSTASRSRFLQPGFFTPPHRLVAASAYTARLMQSTFAVPQEKIIEAGLPRDDVLFSIVKGAGIDAHEELENCTETLKARGIRKILLYAPTFRPDGSNPLLSLDMQQLNTMMDKLNYHLLLLLHPKFARKDLGISKTFKHISYLSPGLDIYPYLKKVDVLVTDYSSLYVDFLLLNKPMIFYTYDYDTYSKEMGLHDDYLSLTPGPHPRSFQELLVAIQEHDFYMNERARVRKILFTYSDGNASNRIVKEILKKK
ncbi:MAG: CDP-glycerol glycerophosphotransferase family protein [Candidatus Pacebacteria bacterium]|nr:CDP-glycerol glycerophosphotransferase family protein [Candidatus Paceibacterota bacterium]MBP9842573.1 CDP-glycerol glycerophosphotransferase family protein [Candidatus Paceibacterota bacterium]